MSATGGAGSCCFSTRSSSAARLALAIIAKLLCRSWEIRFQFRKLRCRGDELGADEYEGVSWIHLLWSRMLARFWELICRHGFPLPSYPRIVCALRNQLAASVGDFCFWFRPSYWAARVRRGPSPPRRQHRRPKPARPSSPRNQQKRKSRRVVRVCRRPGRTVVGRYRRNWRRSSPRGWNVSLRPQLQEPRAPKLRRRQTAVCLMR